MPHSGVKPFPCSLCDKKCREKTQLIKHLLKKHQVKKSDVQNYVKMMPKTEVVKNEDMQNLLQNIGQVKTEPVVDIGVFQPDEQTSNKRNVDGTGKGGGLDNI